MKRVSFLLAAVCLMVSTACGQQRKSPAATADGSLVSVKYSSPQKNNREIYGKLVPYGKVWRTGADSSTYVTFKRAVKVGDKALPAGNYSFFTIPGEKEWTVIFNKAPRAWGSYSYDEGQDAARLTVPTKAEANVTEGLTFRVDKAGKGEHLIILWDKTSVHIPVEPA